MEGAPFSRVRDVARWVRDELQLLGVDGHVKTSGARGLHIYLPMRPGTPFESAQLFCRLIASVVAGRHPEAATVERALKRSGRARSYLDCLQNGFGKSLALRLQRARQRLRGRVDTARVARARRRQARPAQFHDPDDARPPARGRRSLGCDAQGEGDRSGGGARPRPRAAREVTVWRPRAPDACPARKMVIVRVHSRRPAHMRSKMPLAVLVLTMSTTLLAARAVRADDDDPAKGKFTLEQATKGVVRQRSADRQDRDHAGHVHLRAVRKAGADHGRQLRRAGARRAPLERPEDRPVGREEALLRRPDLPPRDPRLHGPGWRSAGRRHRQPGYRFEDEFSPELKFDKPAPARDGERRTGTRTVRSSSSPRARRAPDGRHTIFGLCEPASLVSKITGVKRGPRDKPETDVVIKKVTISRGKAKKSK